MYDPLVSETRTFPSASGVSPLGPPTSVGGLCTHEPVVPIWLRTEPPGLMKRMRQLSASATVVLPFFNRYASSGSWR
jgi:hypothetical protein